MKTKATSMMRRNDGCSSFRQSALFIAAVALGTATAVHAADCYWAGGTSSAWETAGNWTTTAKKPTNDGAYFRKDKFADRFKNDKYVVTFSAAETNTWRTYFNNCGTANEPIILRANNATSGLTGGDAKDNTASNQEGIYIGTSYTAGTSGSHDTKASDGDAYVRFEKGTFATGAKYSYWFLGNGSYSGHMTVAGATINSPNAFYLNRGSLTVESGTVSMSGDLKMGTNGDTTLTVNGGKLTVGLWPRFESSSYAKTINLSGGTMEAYIIRNVGGSGAMTISFDGGTLFATTTHSTYGLIDSGITVKVGSRGGTINANGKDVKINSAMNEDPSSLGGGMKFCGGGSVTLNGAVGWTGGTTIEAGTTVKIDSMEKKNAILGHGLNTLKVIPASGTHTLVTITGDGFFSEGDELKASIAPGAAGSAVFSLSNDRKSLMVFFTYAGEAVNASTPTLVFPGAKLADLATHTLCARMGGANFDAGGMEATFFDRQETVEDEVLTKVTYQLQALDDNASGGHYTKAAKVEFTEDEYGVYAKLVDGNYTNYDGQPQFGTDPLETNPGTYSYIPYGFRLVAPVTNSININIDPTGRSGAENTLDTTSAVRYGAGEYAVPYSAWTNFAMPNTQDDVTAAIGGVTMTVSGQKGNYYCSHMNASTDVRHGYIDDSGDKANPTITVSDIPYEFYRVVVYMSSDTANCQFGHLTINGRNYTASGDALTCDTVTAVEGAAAWGLANAGAGTYLFGLKSGLNYLASPVTSGSTATIVGHRQSGTVRTGIAAIQIIEHAPETYTATIADGGMKTLSALSWDRPLPATLSTGDRLVVNVEEDATLNINLPVEVFEIAFNVAEGKTLALAGGNIDAAWITATGAGEIAVAGSASQLAGTLKGDGTVVYDGVRPSSAKFTDLAWTGTVWVKNISTVSEARRDWTLQNYGNVGSTLRLTNVNMYFANNATTSFPGTIDLSGAGMNICDGYSGTVATIARLTGNGTLSTSGGSVNGNALVIGDISGFTGTMTLTKYKVTVGASSGTSADGALQIDAGYAATVAAGKTWTAPGGMVVNGTLTIGDGATAPGLTSGTGTIAAASGTGRLNGYGDAAVTLVTAADSTLAIVDSTRTSITIGGLDNQGVLDLTATSLSEATLLLAADATTVATGTILYPDTFRKFVVKPIDQTLRSLTGFDAPETLPAGVAYYVVIAETREEFGKGHLEVTDVPAGVNVRVTRPNGTVADLTPVGGTATLVEAPQIAQEATAFDFTYTNVVECAYYAPGLNIGTSADTKPVTFNNELADDTTGAYIKHHPWVTGAGNLVHSLEDFTIVLVGTMSPSHNTQFFHMGTTTESNTGLLITTTENDDEVLIAKNTGATVDAANGVKASVPNAASARHAYVIYKRGTVFEVWVDGVKRGQFNAGEGFALAAGGMQVGSDHGGYIRNAGVYKGVPVDDGETGVVNVLRMYDYAISEAQAEAVFNAYPYVAEGGLYTRTVAADGSFAEADAWEKEGASGTFTVPEGVTIDNVLYNPSATLTVEAPASLAVNATVAIETFTVGGSAPVKFTSDGTHTVTVGGAAIINSPVTNEYGAVYLAGAPVQLGSAGSLTFDMSGYDISGIYETTRVQLTGLTDQDDEKFSIIPPPDDPDRTTAIAYNPVGSCYDFVIMPTHNYIFVKNLFSTSIEGTDDNIAVGAGGIDVEALSVAANGAFVYDPIKTPIYVWGTEEGSLVIGEGAKFVLTPNYANMTLGRIVLLTYFDGSSLPENLNDLLDPSSITSGATWNITSEEAPNPDDGRRQLVLTVGDYENEAKEIRITCIGDSITQGTGGNIDGVSVSYTVQYRTSIAARLAANGYRPKMLGIWKYGDWNASHVNQPEDWVWHSGISGDRIVTSGTRGGVRDNLHVYLDVAGNVDVITLLIGTNDLGGGRTAAETYADYVSLVAEIARLRPATKIIGSTLLDRGDGEGTANHDAVVAFNELLKAGYQADAFPANFVLLDLFEAVPLTTTATGNFFDDKLHPNWIGDYAIAEGFAAGIMSELPLATYAGPIEDEATDEPQQALGVAGIAATTEGAGLAAYTNGMVHVFTIDAASSNNVFAARSPYTVVTRTGLSRPILKAGYFMELVRKGTSHHRWVWVDFDASGKTLDDVDFPWYGANIDFIADNMHVFSNDGSIHNVAPDVSGVRGAIEGTHFNYSGGDDNESVPADFNEYGWNDTLGSSNGYGGFQAHRIFDANEHWSGAEVLFAWNAWGTSNTTVNDEVGIGTFFYSAALGGGNSADYTFTKGATSGAAQTISAAGYQVVHLEIWATLDGGPRHGVWCGMDQNCNFDDPENWEDGRVPSVGESLDFSAAPANVTIAVTGDYSLGAFGTATMGTEVVTFTGSIEFEAITDTSKIAVGENSVVTLNSGIEYSGSEYYYIVESVAAGGRFVVTGDIVANEEMTGYVFHSRVVGEGAVQARGLVNNATGNSDLWAFRLCGDSAAKAYWIIGDHGIGGSRNFWINGGRHPEIQPLDADFTISTKIGSGGDAITFNTTGADGNPHTITIGDGTAGLVERTGTMNVIGTGRLLANFDGPTLATSCSYPVNVSAPATLAINPEMNLSTGAITIASGATLEVAQSGTVTPAGALSLADGAILGFNFTSKIPPVLDLTGKAVTLGSQKSVVVKVSSTGGVRSYENKCMVTAGGNFAGANPALGAVADWVKGTEIEDGNIVINLKPAGSMLFFR